MATSGSCTFTLGSDDAVGSRRMLPFPRCKCFSDFVVVFGQGQDNWVGYPGIKPFVHPVPQPCLVPRDSHLVGQLIADKLHRVFDTPWTRRPAAHRFIDPGKQFWIEPSGFADMWLLPKILGDK